MYPKNNQYGLSNSNPKSVDILEKIKKTGSFQLTPEDESFIRNASGQGFTEAQIIKGIQAKKKIVAADTSNVPTVDPNNLDATTEIDTTAKVDPFAGKTRTQFLKEAFMSGVTSITELEKLGKTYDLLATPEDTFTIEGGVLPSEKQAIKQVIEKQAVEKVAALPDATARESALGALATFRSGNSLMQTIESDKVKTGFLEGVGRQGVFGLPGGRALGNTSKEEDEFFSATEIFAANYRKAMSGLTVNEGEMRRLDRLLPSEAKTKQQNIAGIKEISKFLADKTSLQLGIDVSPLAPEETGKDPLNIFGTGNKNDKKNPLDL